MNLTRILLIVENPHQGELIEKILGNKFLLVKTNDFYRALDNLDDKHFDVLLVYSGLIKHENLNFIKKIHTQHPSLPLLIIVDKFDEEITTKAFEYGAQDYLITGEFTTKSLERSIFNAIKKLEMQSKLRSKAEKLMENKYDMDTLKEIPKKFTEAIHELQVHRIELEMQNEELRKTWIELEQSRRKFKDLYDLAPVGYFSMDEKGIILNVNLTGASLLNTERDNLIDKAFILFLSHDSRREFHKHIKKVFKTGHKQICQVEIIKKGMEGEKFDAELETVQVNNESGNFKELRTVLTDITGRKQAQLSMAKLAALVISSDDAIVGMDLDGKITSWNFGAEKMYGYGVNEVLGKSIRILSPPESADKIVMPLNVVNGEIVKNYQTKRLTKYGKEIGVSLTVSPIYGNNGNVVGASSIARDITEIKKTENELQKYRENLEEQVKERTEELENANFRLKNMIREHEKTEEKLSDLVDELKRSNNELEQFAYIASHDLQEPLRMVSSFTQLLERKYKDELDEDAHEYINFAVDGAKRMQTLINDLLTYSRVTTRGKDFTKIDINEIVKQALFNLEMRIEENDAIVDVDELPEIYADEFQMVQLFQNLIGNAIKYRSKEPPHICISAEKDNNEWIFKISDNGIGIAQEYYERIFTIFQRLHEIHTYSGTGVGLAICKKIVERHGGRIWVDSEYGKGSSFYFSIPDID